MSLGDPGDVLYMVWVRRRAIQKGIDFPDIAVRKDFDFHNFGTRNDASFQRFGRAQKGWV